MGALEETLVGGGYLELKVLIGKGLSGGSRLSGESCEAI